MKQQNLAATTSDAKVQQQETKVQIFQKEEFGQVRTTLDENGEPLFCLSDVCKVLELDSSQVRKRLDDGVFTIHPIIDSLQAGRTDCSTVMLGRRRQEGYEHCSHPLRNTEGKRLIRKK